MPFGRLSAPILPVGGRAVRALAAAMIVLASLTVSATAGADGPPFAMIGDSITWQATDHLREALPGIRGAGSDGGDPVGDEELGVIGRGFSRADAALARILARGTPDVLIVALGTNPTMTVAQVDAFMARAATIDRVVFVNIRIPRAWEGPTNDLINSLPDRFVLVSEPVQSYVCTTRCGLALSDSFHPRDRRLCLPRGFFIARVCIRRLQNSCKHKTNKSFSCRSFYPNPYSKIISLAFTY